MAGTVILERRPRLARFELNPSQTLVVSFAAIILAGGFVLSQPISTTSGQPAPLLTAMFTATSATCVTGLIVVDTADYWSSFGELVILVLIQLGGLGYMTISLLMAMAIGRRIGLRERVIQQESLNVYTLGGIVRFTRTVLLLTIAIEAIGALLLMLRWWPQMGAGRAAYLGLFHSISSFNNAGFDLMGGFRSLTPFVGDVAVNLTVALLIILGGLGFTVLVDIGRPKRFTLHAKVVLATTASLIVLGTIFALLLEFRNPGTLGRLPLWQKVLAAFFQSVTPRTGGFNTLDMSRLLDPTLMLIVALMFIGASPGGTGGGIKTTTFVAPMAVILSMLRGRPDPELFRRRLPPAVVYKAVTIALIAVAFVVTMATVLSFTERVEFIHALFETTSAFGTVGLTTGLTPNLSNAGQMIIMFTVFSGRVGLLTLAFALTGRQHAANYRYPEERILIG